MRLIDKLKKSFCLENPRVVYGIFVIISIIFCRAIFFNFDYWGQKDWDQFTFWHTVPYKTILDYHQFPLWNPYTNGGTVSLAHPHSGFLSPFFIFVLIFGPVIGLKLQICIFLFLGMLGMFYLARFFEIKGASAYLPSFIFMLSAVFPLHLTEGHVEFLSMAFIPWAFLFVLKSSKDLRYTICAIIVLSAMIFSGSIYPFVVFLFFLVFYLFLQYVKTKNRGYVVILFLVIGGTFLLSNVKILPMQEFLAKNERIITQRDGVGLPLLLKALTDRNHVTYDEINWKPTGVNEWHEYGAYIGILSIILFLISIVMHFKKHWPLILSSFLALLIVIGNRFYVDFWGLLHRLPIFKGLSTQGTFIIGFIFGFSILSGLSLYRIESALTAKLKKKVIGSLFAAIIVLFILTDLILVNSKIFKNAFVIEPMEITPLSRFYQIYGEILDSRQRSSIYPALLRNCGIINGYEVIGVKQGAISAYPENLRSMLSKEASPVSHETYTGFAYLANQRGRAQLNYFSPNLVRVSVYAKENEILLLNQNFFNGWKIKEPGYKLFSYNGLIAAKVTPGTHHLTFYYLPNSFLVGAAVSCATLILIFCIYFKLKKRPE